MWNNKPYTVDEPRCYDYEIITPPAILPVDIEDLKAHARIDYSDNQQPYLNMLLASVVQTAQEITNNVFISTKYKTYRDYFDEIIELRKAPNATLTAFKYYNTSNVLTDVDSNIYYTITREKSYSIVLVKNNYWYPDSNVRDQEHSIILEFTAGFGATKDNVPADLRLAMLQHATHLYQNRGDVSLGADERHGIPAAALSIYNRYKIVNLSGAVHYE